MPYNLRKRKAPEPEPVEEKPAVKKTTAKKPAAKKAAKEKPAEKKPRVKKVVEKEPEESAAESIHEEEKAEPKKPSVKKVRTSKAVEKKPEPEPEPEESGDDTVREEKEEPVDKKQKVVEPVEEKRTVDVIGGKLLVFGEDSCGEFGLKKIGFTKKNPVEVPIPDKIVQVACGVMHTLSLTESGLVYSHGCNDDGALGRITDGDETLEATPAVVELKNKVIKITTGDSHGLALTDKQEVFIWGNFRDEHSLVGLSPESNGLHSFEPLQLLPKTKFKDIASGARHALLLDTKGLVYSFGVGDQGQLGRLSPEEIEDIGNAKIAISEAKDAVEKAETEKNESELAAAKAKLDKAKAVMAEKRKLFLTPQVVDLKNVDPQRPFVCDAIYAGGFCSFATNTDKKKNRLAGWGLNNFYQLGYKGQKGQTIQHYPKRSTFTCATSMIGVACGEHHTLFLTRTGRVCAAGRNEYGMLGLGNSSKDKKEVCPAAKVESGFDEPIRSICAGSNNASFAVDAAGKLFSWGMNGPSLGVDSGDNDLIVPTQVTSLANKKVLSVSTGSQFAAVIVH